MDKMNMNEIMKIDEADFLNGVHSYCSQRRQNDSDSVEMVKSIAREHISFSRELRELGRSKRLEKLKALAPLDEELYYQIAKAHEDYVNYSAEADYE